jgi:hypothetical protein
MQFGYIFEVWKVLACFLAIWNLNCSIIYWQLDIIIAILVHFPVLVCCAKKNLATLGLDGPIFAGKI